jgi:hypothetical protein
MSRYRMSLRCLPTAVLAATMIVAASRSSQAQTPEATPQEAPPPQETTDNSMFSHMRLRGYSDVGFGKPLQEKLPEGGLQAGTTSFQIADLHLFFTSKLSDHWSFLSELLITSDFTNEFGAEIDRLMIQYQANKYFKMAWGKFNAGVGYYTNEFHRAKFFQTATGRPLMFTDEDNGGILPVHQVGVTVSGEIPSGSLGLRYLGEVTNGRAYKDPDATPVQNWADENNLKAYNGGLSARPDALPGLDVGFSVYRDTIEPPAGKMHETISAVHGVYVTPNFEFLNEFVLLQHTPDGGGETATTRSFYTQVSHRFNRVRPYVRYEQQHVPEDDPVFGAFGSRKAISGGVRFELEPFAVLKVQYDHARQYNEWANGAHVQLAFAF